MILSKTSRAFKGYSDIKKKLYETDRSIKYVGITLTRADAEMFLMAIEETIDMAYPSDEMRKLYAALDLPSPDNLTSLIR